MAQEPTVIELEKLQRSTRPGRNASAWSRPQRVRLQSTAERDAPRPVDSRPRHELFVGWQLPHPHTVGGGPKNEIPDSLTHKFLQQSLGLLQGCRGAPQPPKTLFSSLARKGRARAGKSQSLIRSRMKIPLHLVSVTLDVARNRRTKGPTRAIPFAIQEKGDCLPYPSFAKGMARPRPTCSGTPTRHDALTGERV